MIDHLLDRLDLSADAGTAGADEAERRLLAASLSFTLALVAFQTIAHLVDLLAFDLRYGSFDADADLSGFAFASASATLLCAAGAALLAAAWPRRARLLVALAAALTYLATDDMFAIHERVAKRLDLNLFGIEDMGRVLWPLVFLPILAGCFLALWAVSTAMRRDPRLYLRAGLALLVFAVGLEMLSIVLVNIGVDKPDLGYELEVVIEEGAELAGWLLIAAALGATVLRGGPANRR